MESGISFFGHPVHAMLVVFPLGLFFTSFLFDLLFVWRKDHFWCRGAFWMILVGEAGALAAVLTGYLDYVSIPMPPHARDIATKHLILGLALVALYGLQLWVRRRHAGGSLTAKPHSPAFLLLAFLSVNSVAVQGWLGGEVSHTHGVGVVAERRRPDARPVAAAPGGSNSATAPGVEVYQRNCAGCHGTKGEGGIGPKLAALIQVRDLEEITAVVRKGKGPMMPGFDGKLSSEEIGIVSGHTHSLMRGEKN